MAYDDGLAQRVRERLRERAGVTEKKMFGGLAFMVNGHMSCGIIGEELMVRTGPDGYEAALAKPHAREMDFTGRSLKGFVYVSAEGVESDDALAAWVDQGLRFAASLPPK